MAQIQRLPSNVAAQIKASANLSSLNDVIIGLLKNAFDAEAERINIKVDFARASCWIYDDGTGIHPSNFEEIGGLCKPFHTSNFSDGTNHLSSKGLFLSSVAAVAVLSITSRYGGFNDANAMISHFSRPPTRLLPAPEHMALELGNSGTKISVHDLFGNMAVRVKQRPADGDARGARDREWNNLCLAVTGCMLAHGKPLQVTMKGGDTDHVFNVNDIQAAQRHVASPSRVNLKLHLAKSIIQSAFHTLVSPIWIPISARTSSMVVQAIMSTEPSPQRNLQFICIGNRYMPPDGPCGILYETVNQTFWSSSFGQTDDDLLNQDKAKGRLNGSRQNFKHWPMFVMLVQCNTLDDAYNVCQQEFTSKLTGTVTAMMTRFLTEHHHRPRNRTQTRNKQAIASQDPAFGVIMPTRTIPAPATTTSRETPRRSLSTSDDVSSELRFAVKFPVNQSKDPVAIHKDDTIFRSQFVSSRTGGTLAENSNTRISSLSSKPYINEGPIDGPISKTYSVNDLEQDTIESNPELDYLQDRDCHTLTIRAKQFNDEYINWTDPRTRQTFCVNVRTGFVVKPKDPQRPATTDDSVLQSGLSGVRQNTLPRLLRSSDGIVPPKDGSWAKKFFQNWHNPVFETAWERLPTASLDSQHFDVPSLCGHDYTSSTDASGDVITQAALRLNKASLREATIISQVDTKFILVRISDSQAVPPNDMIVLVDQHAADERVGVEKLLEDLCSAPGQEILTYVSPLNQKSAINTVILEQPLLLQIQSQEHNLFERVAPFFAQWGILYDLIPSTDPQQSFQLVVLSLPACIAQRCKLEPMLLFNLLRSEAWKRQEESSNMDQTPSTNVNWVAKIRSCPSGILDLINSRACRSAIMFNDVLTVDQCKKLISDLAKCQFPFQCAHGRPSMVPLLNLGEDGSSADISHKKDDFADSWKLWTNKQ